MNQQISQLDSFASQIKTISEFVNVKEDSNRPTTAQELLKEYKQNNQLIQKIYALMLAQHSKLKICFKQKAELEQRLQKIKTKYVQSKKKQKQLQKLKDHSYIQKQIEINTQNYIPLNDGVYSILHFKNESMFQEIVPYLQNKAQFLTIQDFQAVRQNMQQTFRTSSRIELQASYTANQLNQKIDSQLSTIKKLSQDIQILQIQNNKLKEEQKNKDSPLDYEFLKNQNKNLEQKLINQQNLNKKLSQELLLIKQEKRTPRQRTPTIIIRR